MDQAEPKEITERILARLVQAEAHEPHVWLQGYYRQAFITVALAARGNPLPFVAASYTMFGVHPDKVWSHIQADRHARLGNEYSNWYDAAGNRVPERWDIPDYDPTSGRVPLNLPEGEFHGFHTDSDS